MVFIHEDPLFYEDWYYRREGLKKKYSPIEGSRTWNIDDAAVEELKYQAVISSDSDTNLIKRLCEAVLEMLDGYKGELGQYIQTISIEQPFQKLHNNMPLIGPVQTGNGITAPVMEYKRDGSWITFDATKWHIEDTYTPVVIFNNVQEPYNFPYDYNDTNYQGRVKYTAGLASNLSGLPADLRTAIYTMAHRKFDSREGAFPQSLVSAGNEVQSVIYKYKKTNDYYF